MTGKICIVTGANTGIGKETALGLAKLGASVVMVCRDRERGEAALCEIKQRSGNDRVEIIDDGEGLPSHVIDHLGEPFNYGTKGRHGFGLGLAWVITICRKYGWTLGFTRTPSMNPKRGSDAMATVGDSAITHTTHGAGFAIGTGRGYFHQT